MLLSLVSNIILPVRKNIYILVLSSLNSQTSFATGWFLSVGPGTFKYLPWSLVAEDLQAVS